MAEIFISYASATVDRAKRIADALRALGYGVCRDDELPAHRAYRLNCSAGKATAEGLEPALTSRPQAPTKPSLAVLPFVNLSSEADQEYFADGMVVEIVAALSRIKSIFVIASGSSLTFKNKALTPQ